MIKHLFLDLEDTVITPVLDGWFNTHMINVDKITDFITEFKPDYVHLFSFAIWNQAEKMRFELGTKDMLERSLGIELDMIPTVDDDIIPLCSRMMNLGEGSVDFQEMSNFWGKHEAFRLWIRQKFKTTSNRGDMEVVLFDDMVFNENFEWPDLKIKGRIINIDEWEHHA